ncbi:MAG: hypothetical protein ACPG4U_13900 [Pseudomonadales bacterium]
MTRTLLPLALVGLLTACSSSNETQGDIQPAPAAAPTLEKAHPSAQQRVQKKAVPVEESQIQGDFESIEISGEDDMPRLD